MEKTGKTILRILGGNLKGEKLIIPTTEGIRPTRQQVREAVFQIWADRIVGAKFLDLFAGSGAISLEALSRGAEEIYVSDTRAEIIFNLRKKVRDLEKHRHDFVEPGSVNISVEDFREALSNHFVEKRKFDLIYLDPPYNSGFGIEAIKLIYRYELLEYDGRIMLEISKQERKIVDHFADDEIYLLLKKYSHGDTFLYHFALNEDES